MSPSDGPVETLRLKVGGMSCSFCVESIRKALSRQRGVAEVHVSLAHEEALVRYRPEAVDPFGIEDTLRALGYTIRDPGKVGEFEERRAAMERERRRLAVAAAFAVGAFAAMLAMWLGWILPRVWHAWGAWGAASLVLFGAGRHILSMARGAARRGIANQHVLLSAGALGGYAAGLAGTPVPALGWWGLRGFPAFDFFGVVIFLTTYHLLSGYVSLLVRTRASESVRKLLDLQPPTARVVRDGREEEVPIEAVEVGDRVRVRPGENVPVDGEVVEGGGAVDEALVTGEPIPAEKAPGDPVIGGSVNQTGTLLVRVTTTGEESFLRQVARHVEEAKALKPSIIVLVDRVLKFYVPAVLWVALGAFLFWSAGWGMLAGEPLWVRGMYAALSVLVLGYPCALGMATPLALIRGGGMAAERGILMRSGEAFQVLKDVDAIVLDKTGTITAGHPRVVGVIPHGGWSAGEVVAWAAAAEASSEHPLGRAIVERAEDEGGLDPARAEEFDSISGGGVEARVDGHAVVVGKPALLEERGIDVEPARESLAGEEERGRTVVLLAVDGELAATIAIADPLKPDAAAAIERMRELGIDPVMLTGDAEATATAVAREVGIDEVHARVRPSEKADRVRALQEEGRRVAFVGDGINDAPALMQADVGIAIGAGTDIAIESSDVILIGERLSAVLDAREIGGKSYRKTVQNLWLAFAFNGIGVPLATTGLVHPVWAMIAMAASVTAVLGNSFGGRLLAGAGAGRDVSPDPGGEVPAGSDPESADFAQEGETKAAPCEEPARVVLDVPDVHCAGCEETIERLLGEREGVTGVEAEADKKKVRVAYWPGTIDLGEIEEALGSAGFRARRARQVTGLDAGPREESPERPVSGSYAFTRSA